MSNVDRSEVLAVLRQAADALAEVMDAAGELYPLIELGEWLVEKTGNPSWRGIVERCRAAYAALQEVKP